MLGLVRAGKRADNGEENILNIILQEKSPDNASAQNTANMQTGISLSKTRL